MAARAQEAKDKKRAALAPWDHLPFREQIRGRAAAIDDEQRVLIERLVSVHFNGSLKMHAGPKARLVDLTPFQLAFMDLLHPLRYEEIIAPAQSQLEDYYADEPDKFAMKEFTADVQGIVLPTETSDRWEIRFAREIGATLVVCNMNGWTTESVILVG